MHFSKNGTNQQTYFMINTKFNWLIFFTFLSLFSICVSLFKGSTLISPNQLFNTIIGHGTPLSDQILFHLRIPRILSAFVTGALLALAGTFMQVLLRNPLADPYVLGISSGAAVAALLSILCGLSGFWLTGGAWIGSLIATLIVFFLTQRIRHMNRERVLLTGIALATSFSAMVSFILVISPDRNLHSMLFWLMGDLSYSHAPIVESIILLTVGILSMSFAKQLNILIRGEREAEALGVNTLQLQLKLYFLTALLTAAAVALAGCIGFIGLIVPHVLRLLCGYDHRWLLPSSVLLGGSLLTIADTLSRTLFAPQQLPVGIMMALLGIPIFLFLLQKELRW